MVAVERHNLGHVEVRRGNADAAERLLEDLANGGPWARYNEAALAYARGERERARELLVDAEAIRAEAGRDDLFELDWLREQLYR